MITDIPHAWLYPESLAAATKVQQLLAAKVCQEDQFSSLDLIGGMDVSNQWQDPKQMVYAAVVVLKQADMSLLTTANAVIHQPFPYIPGFLGFREAPALVKAYQQLPVKPSLILVDGHGISHPRSLGIASHIGVLLDCPTIGVAKSILVGKPAAELGAEPGAQVPLQWQNQTIAMLLRTKKRALPLIISTGHRVSLATAVTLVQQYLTKYRLPEPTRQAHLAANACRIQYVNQSTAVSVE